MSFARDVIIKTKDLKDTGKYWALRYKYWVKVKIIKLPECNRCTGCMYISPDYRQGLALSNCQIFIKVTKWGKIPPKISVKRMIEAGADPFWFRKRRDK